MSNFESWRGGLPTPRIEQEGYSVRENLPEQPARQVPHIARPHSLYAVASGELTENGVYAVAKPAQEGAFGMRISVLGGVWGQKLYTHTCQFFFGLWRMVVAISNEQPGSSLDNLRHDRKLVGVGGSHREAADHSRPRDPNVQPETVEGLPEEGVLAEGGLSLEPTTAVGAGQKRHAGPGIESQIAKVGSWGVSAKSSCQRRSLTFQRLAA